MFPVTGVFHFSLSSLCLFALTCESIFPLTSSYDLNCMIVKLLSLRETNKGVHPNWVPLRRIRDTWIRILVCFTQLTSCRWYLLADCCFLVHLKIQ